MTNNQVRISGCHICGKGMRERISLHRCNETGVPGIWACTAHRGRVGCAVPFCRKTTKGHYTWTWICGAHWRLVPRRMKLPYFRVRRSVRLRGEWTPELIVRHDRLLLRLARAAKEAVFSLN